jgi:hypothetical protein
MRSAMSSLNPELDRMSLEVLSLALISMIVVGSVARRRSLGWGVGVGFLVAVVLWCVILYVEFRFLARWA